ncbi:DUF6056 family protein [Erwinia billingiae]|uniref:DUF6056 family protein n=1 Tax=Erwinia billingiae TaxID=182337 RepID=UPI00320AC4C4
MNSLIKRELQIFALVSFVIYVSVVLVAPMAGEDYGLTRLFHTEGIFERLSYAVNKSSSQMATWNARLGEQIAIFELSLPKWISIFIYSFSFILFSICIAMLSSKKDENKWKQVSLVAASLTFLIWPGMEVFFWKTANSEYLQTMLLIMIVAIPYAKRHSIEEMKKNRKLYIAYLIVCFLAGMSFENVPFSVAISFLTLCVWEKRKNITNYLPIMFLLGGWLCLITAHSTSIRRNYYANTIQSNSNPIIHYTERFKDIVSTFFDTSSLLLALSIISLIYLSRLKLISKYHIALIIASVLVVGSMLASPYTEARSFLFAWCVMFSIICYACTIALIEFKIKNLLTLILLISTCFGIYTFHIYSSYGNKMAEREIGIINALGTEKCNNGYKIKLIMDDHGYRYINNRDEWYYNQVTSSRNYYDCNITK